MTAACREAQYLSIRHYHPKKVGERIVCKNDSCFYMFLLYLREMMTCPLGYVFSPAKSEMAEPLAMIQ